MNCSLRLAALAKCYEHFNEHFAMKRRQRRSKQLSMQTRVTLLEVQERYEWSMEMTRVEHGLIENDISWYKY